MRFDKRAAHFKTDPVLLVVPMRHDKSSSFFFSKFFFFSPHSTVYVRIGRKQTRRTATQLPTCQLCNQEALPSVLQQTGRALNRAQYGKAVIILVLRARLPSIVKKYMRAIRPVSHGPQSRVVTSHRLSLLLAIRRKYMIGLGGSGRKVVPPSDGPGLTRFASVESLGYAP